MDKKKAARLRRAKKARAQIRRLGKPRLTVHRSRQHIYAQVINSEDGHVLASASTLQSDIREGLKGTSNKEAAAAVGKAVAERAVGVAEELARIVRLLLDTGQGVPEYLPLLERGLAETGRGDELCEIVLTHGHEDHIGALAHLLEEINAPVYATRLTRGLIEVRLKRERMLERISLRTYAAGEVLNIGPFTVEPYHVCHSIPDSVGLGITTPAGLIVHSGDFKLDETPAELPPVQGRGSFGAFADQIKRLRDEQVLVTGDEVTGGKRILEVGRELVGADLQTVCSTWIASLSSRTGMPSLTG